jgi:hypothetical protein
VYKRRIVLGGAAPAAVLALGIFAAGPAMAATATLDQAQAPTSVVSSAIPDSLLSGIPGVAGATGMVNGLSTGVPAISTLPAASDASGAVQNVEGAANDQQGDSSLPDAGAVSNALGSSNPTSGLSDVAGSLSGQSSQNASSGDDAGAVGLGNLGSATSNLPAVDQATGLLGGLSGANGDLPGLSTVTGALGGASSLTSGGPLG